MTLAKYHYFNYQFFLNCLRMLNSLLVSHILQYRMAAQCPLLRTDAFAFHSAGGLFMTLLV